VVCVTAQAVDLTGRLNQVKPIAPAIPAPAPVPRLYPSIPRGSPLLSFNKGIFHPLDANKALFTGETT
jgi:hypothetical protein